MVYKTPPRGGGGGGGGKPCLARGLYHYFANLFYKLSESTLQGNKYVLAKSTELKVLDKL